MQDFGKLLLRLTVGGLMLFHGINKLENFKATLESTTKKVTEHGLPEVLAYGVFIGEALAPVLLILGILPRISAFIIAINMVAAVYLAHQADITTLGKGGAWGIELQAFYFFTALTIVFIGPGRFSLMKRG